MSGASATRIAAARKAARTRARLKHQRAMDAIGAAMKPARRGSESDRVLEGERIGQIIERAKAALRERER